MLWMSHRPSENYLQLSAWLSFLHEKDSESYTAFMLKDISWRVLSGLITLVTACWCVFFIYEWNSSAFNSQVSLAICISIIPLCCMWSYAYLMWLFQEKGFDKTTLNNITKVGNMILVTVVISFGPLTILRSYDFPFNNSDQVDFNNFTALALSMVSLLSVEVLFSCHSFEVTVLAACLLFTQTVVTVLINGNKSLLQAVIGLHIPLFLTLYFINMGMKKRYLLGSELQAARKSLSEMKQEKDRVHAQTVEMHHMIGSMAHDLKTPLQAFAFEIDNLEEAFKESKNNNLNQITAEDSISLLRGTISFMTVAINRSLDYTKVSTGVELTPSISSVNVNETIEWVINSLSRKTRNSVSIRVGDFVGDISKFILTDKQWLIENVFCFLSNAQKFTSEGEIVVRCVLPAAQSTPAAASTASASSSAVHGQQQSQTQSQAQCESGAGGREEEKHAMLTVEVMDSGIGLSDDQKEGLFRPFKQAQRGAGGTGLGLYSLLKRVECLGGECGVRDRPDKRSGSVFWFSIPYIPDEDLCTAQLISDEAIPETESVSVTESVPDGRSKRILVVDDSLLIQKATRRSLEREGFSVDVADNGYECLKLLNSIEESGDGGYDLILLDIHMPIMDGLETVKRIRSQESKARFSFAGENDECGDDCNGVVKKQHRDSIVVGFSANSDEATMSEALESGMDAFISKPLATKDFKELYSRFCV